MGGARVHGIGNVGKDAELKGVGQSDVLSFSIACTEKWKDKSGEQKEATTWLRCDLWGPRAKALAPHIKKGTKLFVEGTIRCNVKGEGDERREFWSVNVDQVEFASSKSDEGSKSSGGSGARYGKSGHGASAKHSAPDNEYDFGGGDDDIPF